MERAAALGKMGEESCPTRTVSGCKKGVSFKSSQEKELHGKDKHALNRLPKLRPSAGRGLSHLPISSDSTLPPLRLSFPI